MIGRQTCRVFALSVLALGSRAPAQARFTIEQFLSPAYPYELVSADRTDRIAWLGYERGMRNVYTAAAPDFEPVQLTGCRSDDGVDLTGLRISDDGSVVVFVRGHAPNRDGWIANPTSDPRGAEREIWAARTNGGEPWRVAIASDPVLSPDGSQVLFTRDGQIHRATVDRLARPADAGDRPLFRAFGRNGSPRWSPDGKQIAFVSDRTDHAYIGVFTVDHPKVVYLAPGVDRDSSPIWSADGERITFLRRPGLPFGRQALGRGTERGQRGERRPPSRPAGARRERVPGLARATFVGGHSLALWTADASTGEGREIWRAPRDDASLASIRSILSAGDRLLFRLERGNWAHWYSMPAAGGDSSPIDLTPGEGFAEQIGISKDGKTLYYSTNVGDIDRRHVSRTPTSGGASVAVTRGTAIETYPAPLASGRWIALLAAGAKQPLSVAIVPAAGGTPEVIFPRPLDGFPGDAQVVPRNVVLTAEDGVEFHNQLFVPNDLEPGERRPAILFTHGGPRRQMLLGYHYRHFYHMAYAVNQYLAHRGYVVISVNYRSGIGYGREFRNAADRGSRGNAEYRDVLAAGRYLQERPDVDPARIGLWGLSYGGLLTAQGLARNSDIFAAGVDMAGVHLWGSSLDPESVSYRSSPIAEIGKWTSPVLLIHGDDDRNVAFSHTTGLVQLLRAHDVPYELIVYPDDVHSSLLFRRWLGSFEAMDAFFARKLKGEGQR